MIIYSVHKELPLKNIYICMLTAQGFGEKEADSFKPADHKKQELSTHMYARARTHTHAHT